MFLESGLRVRVLRQPVRQRGGSGSEKIHRIAEAAAVLREKYA